MLRKIAVLHERGAPNTHWRRSDINEKEQQIWEIVQRAVIVIFYDVTNGNDRAMKRCNKKGCRTCETLAIIFITNYILLGLARDRRDTPFFSSFLPDPQRARPNIRVGKLKYRALHRREQ